MVAWKLFLYHGGICGVFALFLSDLRSDIDTSDHIQTILGKCMLVGISGLFVSILYPTLLLFVQQYYPSSIASTATGTIISIATIFDIAFNLLFGKIIDQMGYHLGFMILPVSMIIFYLIVNFLIKKYKPLRNLGEA